MTESEKYYKEGNLLFDKKEYDKAIDCYLKAIGLNPNSKVLFNKLRITCYEQYNRRKLPKSNQFFGNCN
jgi:tetratricopeptide (TPR) repeat protein